MDVQYGIAVTNKYSVFIDDEDPLELLRQKEEEAKSGTKKDKKKKKPVAAESKPKQQEQLQQIKREDVSQPRQNGRGGGGGRGGRGRELRENDGSRPPRRLGPRENFKGDENVPPEMRDRGNGPNRRERGEGQGGFDRGGRGNRGSGRGGRGRGRGGPRPESARGNFGGPMGERRREFDRHSGTDRTGVKATDKREGTGAHNWGSYRDDVEDQSQNQNPADVSGEWASAPEQQENADHVEGGEAALAAKEEEPKEMTLDEWKALQDQQRVKSTFNIRKAGEGVDSNQWKKGVAYKKKQAQDEEDDSEEEEEEEEDRHGHRKHLVTDIRITFADNPRRGGRGGRGGRGRGGIRGGRGGYGGDRPNKGQRESAPCMDDETDFPRLVKSEA